MEQLENQNFLEERYQLVVDRIREIPGERSGQEGLGRYFASMSEFLLLLDDTRTFLKEGGLEKASLEELQKRNRALYEDVLPKHYDISFGNPKYAVKTLGEEYGQMLCWLHRHLYLLIEDVYEGRTEELTAGMELFMEIYNSFAYDASENRMPKREEIRDIIYWYNKQ